MPRQYPTVNGAEPAVELGIDPAKIHDVFAADLPAEAAAVAGATQRPVAELAFSEPNGPAAWRRLPSWAVVATADRAAGTDIVRSMAQRAGATVTEVMASHMIILSQPNVVVDVILSAIEHTSSGQPASASTGATR
jgi:pimeloyl-ACP methyl ester carboxylesterase